MSADPGRNYSPQEVQEKLAAELHAWKYQDGWIVRDYKTSGWPHTLLLVNTIGYLAEAAWHHPDLEVAWASVRVKLMTHSAKGITDKDFAFAKQIEQTATWLPAAGSALEGFEVGFKKKWTH